MNKNCCLNCSRRILGCHCICEDYKQYKEYLELIKKRREAEKDRFVYIKYTPVRC